MPCAPRYNKKGTKVAYSVMGTPQNILFKRSKWQQYVNKMLISQESSRVK
jgi:ornithine carbamoyltransferase